MTRRTIPRWLPNAISALRIAMVPAWLWCAESANRGETAADVDAWRHGALAILLLIGLSDVVDGQLARRFCLQSPLGANLDAVADKLTQVAACTYFALRDGDAFAPLPVWFLGLLIARDALLLVGFACIHRRRGRVHAEHRAHGRIASVLLFVLLLVQTGGASATTLQPMLLATAAMFVGSTAAYTLHGIRQFRAPMTGDP